MGEVILGMPGQWANDYHEAADHYTTKVGGLPDWPIPDLDIRPNFLECGACESHLSLVMQLYAPVCSDSLKIEERVIYVFGCTMKECGPLSWRALRVQKINTEEATPPNDKITSGTPSSEVTKNRCSEDIQTASSFGDDSDDDDLDLEELGRAFSEAASLVSDSKKPHRRRKNVKKASAVKSISKSTDTTNSVLPCFYIYSQKESLSSHISTVSSNYSSLSVKEKDDIGDDSKGEEKWEEEGYEYDSALFVDRTFLKFKKHTDAYPEQCFRYSYGGKPLLASKELETPADCGLCGGIRQYEVQLMPPLLYFLHEASDGSSTHSSQHWNWITLIIYTCSKNCFSVTHQGSSNKSWSVAEESVIMQFE